MKVSILDIYIPPRMRQEYGDLDDLAADLLENKQLQPILIRPPLPAELEAPDYKGQKYALVAGGRRCAAMARAGILEAEAYLREDLDSDLKAGIAELHENLKRLDMTHVEIADAKQRLFELRRTQNPKITAMEVAMEIGDSPATFSRDLESAKAMAENPELRKAGSRKAVLRAKKMADEVRRASENGKARALATLQQRVVTADMLEWLPNLPKGSMDLMLTDLPYGLNYWKSGQKSASWKRNKSLSEYDDTEETTSDLYEKAVPLMLRATKRSGWFVAFASAESYELLEALVSNVCVEHFCYREDFQDAFVRVMGSLLAMDDEPERGDIRRAIEDIQGVKESKTCECQDAEVGKCRFLTPEVIPWIWYRPNSRNRPRHPELHLQNVYEYILVCNMGDGRICKPRPGGNVFVYDSVYSEERIHANQKPRELYEDIITTLTFSGAHCCDPSYGSGASLAAAAATQREPYGCDKNPAMLQPALGMIVKYIRGEVVTPPASEKQREVSDNIQKMVRGTPEEKAEATAKAKAKVASLIKGAKS